MVNHGNKWGCPETWIIIVVNNGNIMANNGNIVVNNGIIQGILQNGGAPNSWMVFIRENLVKHPKSKMDENWGYPYVRKPPYNHFFVGVPSCSISVFK